MIETERRFLVKTLPPDIKVDKAEHIMQGYITPMKDKTQVRLRKIFHHQYFLTIKTKAGHEMQRIETEVSLTQSQFNDLWPTVDERFILKVRCYIRYDDHILIIDKFDGHLNGLITMEVEFPSLEKALAFTPPDWMGREITNDKLYGNRRLAEFGLPEELKIKN
ncbi:MAG: adenylate cyclase [Parcubacteria group bacterium Gr01-1014_44]|nr:MAG: adenylate cyclase [Parcubacteria group bacterium Gr01-1014_44]